MRENKLTFMERQDLYKELIEIWKNSEKISYKDLENYQLKKFGFITWKNGTLRSKFSKESIAEQKGIYARNRSRDERAKALGVARELQDDNLNFRDYNKILTSINEKYIEDSKILYKDLKDSIQRHDKKQLEFVEKAFNTLKIAREFDLKLNRIIDIEDYTKLEIEEIKLERVKKLDKHKVKMDNKNIKIKEQLLKKDDKENLQIPILLAEEMRDKYDL